MTKPTIVTPEIQREREAHTQTMRFALMFVGCREISPDNVEDVFRRIFVYERGLEPLQPSGDFLTLDDVKAQVGLRTEYNNVSESKFHTQLGKLMVGRLLNRYVSA